MLYYNLPKTGDPDRTGTLSVSNFTQILRNYRLALPLPEVEKLAVAAEIDYEELYRSVAVSSNVIAVARFELVSQDAGAASLHTARQCQERIGIGRRFESRV